MAEIALVFHWPPDVLLAMDLGELIAWRERAVALWNQINRSEP